jgi:hypothetical protein
VEVSGGCGTSEYGTSRYDTEWCSWADVIRVGGGGVARVDVLHE